MRRVHRRMRVGRDCCGPKEESEPDGVGCLKEWPKESRSVEGDLNQINKISEMGEKGEEEEEGRERKRKRKRRRKKRRGSTRYNASELRSTAYQTLNNRMSDAGHKTVLSSIIAASYQGHRACRNSSQRSSYRNLVLGLAHSRHKDPTNLRGLGGRVATV